MRLSGLGGGLTIALRWTFRLIRFPRWKTFLPFGVEPFGGLLGLSGPLCPFEPIKGILHIGHEATTVSVGGCVVDFDGLPPTRSREFELASLSSEELFRALPLCLEAASDIVLGTSDTSNEFRCGRRRL
nr:hypothetical protein [Haloferax sp. BAB-2207]